MLGELPLVPAESKVRFRLKIGKFACESKSAHVVRSRVSMSAVTVKFPKVSREEIVLVTAGARYPQRSPPRSVTLGWQRRDSGCKANSSFAIPHANGFRIKPIADRSIKRKKMI